MSQDLRPKREEYSLAEFRDLDYPIRQTAYILSNLQEDSYILWRGFDPENALELEGLRMERDTIIFRRIM